MGTWGNGPFDDDGASDWAWELEEATDWGFVEVALRGAADIDPNRYLRAPAGQIAWAAAAVVAAVDDPTISLPDEISDWLGRFGEARPREVRTLALGALRRVLGDESELAELWREAGEEDVWRAWVEEVEAVLVSPPTTIGDNAVGERVAEPPEPRSREQEAMALLDEGEDFYRDGLAEQAIERFDLGIARGGEASDPALRDRVTMAMNRKAHALQDLDRWEEAIEAYDVVVRRIGDAPEPPLRDVAAHALWMKGALGFRGELVPPDAAIESFDLVVERFGDAPEPAIRSTVGSALLMKGHILKSMGRSNEAIEAYDLVVKRFGEASNPMLRELVQKATNYKEEAEGRSPDVRAT